MLKNSIKLTKKAGGGPAFRRVSYN